MEQIKHYFFYVLLCADQTLYGGFTIDLKRRLNQHNAGTGAKYTRNKRPVKMIYHEEFNTKSEALKAEYAFKHQTRSKKELFLLKHGVDLSSFG
ncbi:GIY-YIG nuclease family protein [Ligilactobacillus pobuzihii]|uniref:GIY-YIG nuclease family protein n=1 Tax=Ligilactobacillus pobuzihii TaxID=449659 RepID=UPI0019D150B3|nr:GIY-YIG nuclease family protein [Ligilactobacillus pobuzihii]MBN7275223.1 GIY-YIG nuclease family protein [Ligilactobacillus pobuzihii]HIZ96556.1 GIY-YIG nuclease family protein [Candidatus Ligilactobacillus excrementavium]